MLGGKKGKVREKPCSPARDRHAETLAGKPQPHGDTEINGDGLN